MPAEEPKRPGRAAALLDLLLCLTFAALWAWPLPARPGVLRDGYDAAQHAWNLAWVAHALTTGGTDLFEANVLAPSHDVLAFTEPLVGYGVLTIPLRAAGLSAVEAANAVSLLLLGLAPFLLSRLAISLGAARGPALAASLAASFGALVTLNLGYVSFAAWGGIAFLVLEATRLSRTGSASAAVDLGAGAAILAWFSLQLFAFALAGLLALAIADLVREPRRFLAETLKRLVFSGIVAAFLLLPLALPLLRVRSAEGFTRDEAQTRRFQAVPRSFLATTPDNPGQQFLPFRSGSETALYPGTVALLLSLAGVVVLFRRSPLRTLAGTGAILAAVGFTGALGYGGPLWPLLVKLAPPLYGGIRTAARFSFLFQTGVALLAAAGATFLVSRVRDRWARAGIVAAAIAAVAIDVRQAAAFAYVPEEPPPVERLLAADDPGGPVLHLPLTHRPAEAQLMLAATLHFRPVVNGVLSHVPARHHELAALLSSRPVPLEALQRLESWPVGTIVLHEHLVPIEGLSASLRFLVAGLDSGRLLGPIRLPHRGGFDWVFPLAATRMGRPLPAPAKEIAESAAAFRARALAAPEVTGPSVESLVLSIDAPAEGAEVTGDLLVRGWAQDEAGPVEILEMAVDGDRREALGLVRVPRPDVAAVLPHLGPCEEAGYEVRLPKLAHDEGRRLLTVSFRSKDGRFRKVERPFVWR